MRDDYKDFAGIDFHRLPWSEESVKEACTPFAPRIFSDPAQPKRKITKVGDACRHCETPVIRQEHKKTPTARRGGYYFAWWLACPRCRALYMVEEAKVRCEVKPKGTP